MPIEIERKFLVLGDSWRKQISRSVDMRQGYLSTEGGKASMRVRVEADSARLNIKAAVVGARRAEYDYEVPLAEGREILDQLCVGRLEKIRHYIPVEGSGEGLTWEVDEFINDNAGLIVAEIELQSESQEFRRPDWLGAEVTQDRRYYNHYLALHPYQSWDHAS